MSENPSNNMFITFDNLIDGKVSNSGLRPSPSVAAVNEKFLSRFGGARFLGCKLFIKPQIDYVRKSHFCATFLCLFYLIQDFQTAFK